MSGCNLCNETETEAKDVRTRKRKIESSVFKQGIGWTTMTNVESIDKKTQEL